MLRVIGKRCTRARGKGEGRGTHCLGKIAAITATDTRTLKIEEVRRESAVLQGSEERYADVGLIQDEYMRSYEEAQRCSVAIVALSEAMMVYEY